MPIDDALEDIKQNQEKNKESARNEYTNSEPKKIIGKFLVDFFSGIQPEKQELSKLCTETIEKTGIYIFNFKPESEQKEKNTTWRPRKYRGIGGSPYSAFSIPAKKTNDSDAKLNLTYELNTKLDDYCKKEVIKLICGQDNLEIDNTCNMNEDIYFCLPELRAIQNELFNNGSSKACKGILHQYIIVLGMDVYYRKIATIAIQKASKNRKIDLTKEIEIKKDTNLAKILSEISPTTRDFIEAAKECKVIDALPTMKEFNNACSMYINKWSK